MSSPIDRRTFNRISRRELLKLTPLVAQGAFAIPKLQVPLLKTGLSFNDWLQQSSSAQGIWHLHFEIPTLLLSTNFQSTTTTLMIPDWNSTNGPSR